MLIYKPTTAGALNLPNILSLSRIVFLFLIAGLLFFDFKGAVSAAFVLFIIASITDWADGYVARRYNMITDFGKLMDALSDKVLTVGMFVTLLAVPRLLPPWSLFLILVIMGREFLITGLRLVAASRGVVLAAEKGGKVKTVFQIIAISLLLFAHALVIDFGWVGLVSTWVFWLGMTAFCLASLLTVMSGYTYLSKYGYLLEDKPSKHGNAQ